MWIRHFLSLPLCFPARLEKSDQKFLLKTSSFYSPGLASWLVIPLNQNGRSSSRGRECHRTVKFISYTETAPASEMSHRAGAHVLQRGLQMWCLTLHGPHTAPKMAPNHYRGPITIHATLHVASEPKVNRMKQPYKYKQITGQGRSKPESKEASLLTAMGKGTVSHCKDKEIV